jgi:hypothetical protein
MKSDITEFRVVCRMHYGRCITLHDVCISNALGLYVGRGLRVGASLHQGHEPQDIDRGVGPCYINAPSQVPQHTHKNVYIWVSVFNIQGTSIKH